MSGRPCPCSRSPTPLPFFLGLLFFLTADEQLVDLWLTTVGVLARSLCKDEAQPLRDNAIMVLR